MPELPEVQALAASLDARLRGAIVDRPVLRSVAALKTVDPPLDALCGRMVRGCGRAGKFITLDLGGIDLVVHLARAGWLRLRAEAGAVRPTLRGPLVMVVLFTDGTALDVTEQGTEKRLALYVVRALHDVPGIARLGVDALDQRLDPALLGSMLRAQTGTLKSVLADQSVIAGIGNAYSDEILHAARLSPFQKAAALDAASVTRLHAAMRGVLNDALARASAADPDSLRNDKKLRMNVHGRTGQPCRVCGDTVREVSFASRSFQYCATCQTGGRVYADRRLSRLLR